MLTYLYPLTSTGQTWPPSPVPSLTDIGYDHATVGAANTITERVNCDMYEHNVSSHLCLCAVVFDTGITAVGGSKLIVGYPAGPSPSQVRITLPTGAIHPDVVIGDVDGVNQCVDHSIGVVYELSGNVYFQQFLVQNLSSTFTVSQINPNATLITADVNNHISSKEPHIDALPDPSIGVCGTTPYYFRMHDYVITWTEDIGSGDQIWATKEDFFNTTPSFTPVYIDEGSMSDIAGTTDVNSPYNKTAYIAYFDRAQSNIFYADWDFASTVNLHSSIETGTFSNCPHIEAQNLNDPTVGTPRQILWEATAQVDLSGTQEPHNYSFDVATSTITTSNFTLINPTPASFDHFQPAVAAGPGMYFPSIGSAGYYGDSTFTTAWYMEDPVNNSDFEAVKLDNSNLSGVPNVLAGFTRINTDAVFPSASVVTGNIPAIGVTTSSNTGFGFFAAYRTPHPRIGGGGYTSDIMTKFTNPASAGFAFKTTGLSSVYPDGNTAVYPNPATDKLYLTNVADGDYTIIDVVGREILAGRVTSKSSFVDVSKLSPGIYIIDIKESESHSQLSFSKN